MEHLFSYAIMGMMFAASVSYLYNMNFPMAMYWLCGGLLNVAVLWNGRA
jgi:VanZ family protein